MSRRARRGALAMLVVACTLLVTTVAWAATSFTIHKVDQNNEPLSGVKFEVYGKPTLEISAPETVDITVTKEWVDASDAEGKRPSADEFAAALHLLADGEEVEGATAEVSGDGDSWTITYQGLPKKGDDGNEITYTVSEDAIKGYITEGSPAENGGTITNSLSREISFKKCWSFYERKDQDKLILPEDYAPYLDLWSTTDASYNPKYIYRLSLDDFTRVENEPIPIITDTGRGTIAWYSDDKGADKGHLFDGQHIYEITYPAVAKYDTEGNELHYALRENHITITGITLAETFNPNGIGIVSPTTKQDFMNLGFDEATSATYESLGFTCARPLTKEEWLKLGFSEKDASMYSSGQTPLFYSDVVRNFWIVDPMYTYGVGEGYALINYYATLIDGIQLIS